MSVSFDKVGEDYDDDDPIEWCTGFCIDLWDGWTFHLDVGVLGWTMRSVVNSYFMVGMRSLFHFEEPERFSHIAAHVCCKFVWLDVLIAKSETVKGCGMAQR